MNIIVSHPTGNANVRAVVTGFATEKILHQFYTSVAYFEKSAWLKYIVKDIARREFNNELKQYTHTRYRKELARHLCNRLGLHAFTDYENSIFGIDAVYKDLDKFVAKKITGKTNAQIAQIVYGYEDGSYYSFTAAKRKGLTCVYDLPIAYWKTARRLLKEEAERLPAWKKTLGGGITDSNEKLDRKTQELLMADLVIAPSSFVADSVVRDFKEKNIIISPFGTPVNNEIVKIHQKSSKRLRVLFAGSMGQRKGLADLAAAIKLLDNENIELVILGSRMESEAFYNQRLPPHTYEPPRPHNEVLKLMSTCDIFCLPSIVEGRALVMQEAMSQNLPIIITKNTGGEDLIKEGETGFLVPIRSPETIAEKINWFFENKAAIEEMGTLAKKHASNYTWEKYTQQIINSIRSLPIE